MGLSPVNKLSIMHSIGGGNCAILLGCIVESEYYVGWKGPRKIIRSQPFMGKGIMTIEV